MEANRAVLLENGLDPDSVQKAIKNARELENFYVLLVIKNGNKLVEEYFEGRNAQDKFHLRSVTKNFTSAIAGIAISEGLLDSLDAPIYPYFSIIQDEDKRKITNRHLLNMTSGLEWNEETEIIDLLENRIQDPVQTLLSRKLTTMPGEAFNYNTVSPHVVSEIISVKVGMPYKAYAKEKLLTPLGIDDFEWSTDPEGKIWGGVGLQLTATDLVKFGQLYLNMGLWEGAQIVPSDWVSLSSAGQTPIGSSGSMYSLQWYVADNLNTKVFYGQGYGGQTLMLFPEENMMIVAFQKYEVSFEQSRVQWRSFLNKIFNPLYRSLK